VAIVADIDDLAPAEFLMTLALTSKTGKLSAVHKGQKVLLAFKEGSIAFAASPAVRERLGSMLVNRGLISEQQLEEALDRQKQSTEQRLLGNVLIEMGVLTESALQEAVESQFQTVVAELLAWDSGVMIFERMDLPDLGAVHVDPATVLVGAGVATDHLTSQSLARLEEHRDILQGGDAAADPGPAVVAESDEPDVNRTLDMSPDSSARDSEQAVRSLFEEMQSLSVSLTAQMTLALLGTAAEVADRGVLLLVHPAYFLGIGGFGPGRDGRPISGQRLRLPRGDGSLFSSVVDGRAVYRGPLVDDPCHELLVQELGGVPTTDVVVVPLVVGGQVVALLYVDGGPEGREIETLEPLGHAVAAVSRALEEDRRATAANSKPPMRNAAQA
jgi:hypothetical protein